MEWSGCCWVPLHGDNGATAGGGSYGYTVTVNDISQSLK